MPSRFRRLVFPRSRILLLLLALAAAALPASGLEISFAGPAVSASGAVAGGEVVVYGPSRQWTGRSTSVREAAGLLADDDGDGAVTLELAGLYDGRGESAGTGEIPAVSLWLAVELAGGEVAVAAPAEFAPREQPFPVAALQLGAGGRLERFVFSGRVVHLLLVRPGAAGTGGAWLLAVGDGGVDDEDGASDGTLAFALSRMRPVGTSPPPPAGLAAGDLVVLLDPDTLDFAVLQLAAGLPGVS